MLDVPNPINHIGNGSGRETRTSVGQRDISSARAPPKGKIILIRIKLSRSYVGKNYE